MDTTRRDEDEIRALLDRWAEATRHDRRDAILADWAAEARVFDVLPPLAFDGAQAYRSSWDAWQPPFELPSLFEIHDLAITAGGDVAFAHFLLRCGGTLPDGKRIEDWARGTVCLHKGADGWRVRHQHVSMPLPVGG
jgi:ketosteroid isomerase-like protein